MYTLPTKTRIAIRRPNRPLVAFVGTVFQDAPSSRPLVRDKIYVELTDWVTREPTPAGYQTYFRWYSFTTGEATPIYQSSGTFEIEPGYALFMSRAGDVTIHLASFSDDPEAVVALDVARDALLEGRTDLATR